MPTCSPGCRWRHRRRHIDIDLRLAALPNRLREIVCREVIAPPWPGYRRHRSLGPAGMVARIGSRPFRAVERLAVDPDDAIVALPPFHATLLQQIRQRLAVVLQFGAGHDLGQGTVVHRAT
jgi:hypothetical protein